MVNMLVFGMTCGVSNKGLNQYSCDLHPPNLCVGDFISNQVWDRGKLLSVLPAELVDEILAFLYLLTPLLIRFDGLMILQDLSL